jgi:hypothetical protein
MASNQHSPCIRLKAGSITSQVTLAMRLVALPAPQIRFLMYHLEIASRMADKSGVGKMTWLLDFEVGR